MSEKITTIYNIFTGGTIGSRINNEGSISTNGDAPFQLTEMYLKNHSGVNFINYEPYRILSENLCAKNLLSLINSVNTALKRTDIDGIIITHGTDTLQYTAAILCYVFAAAKLPIMIVSSDFVLDDARANGLINYTYAADFIINKRGHGVFVSYCNKGGIPTIHRGSRLQPPVPYSGDVSSVSDSWYGKYCENGYIANPDYKVSKDNTYEFVNPENVNLSDCSDFILRIPAYPGFKYPALSQKTKAVLHESFHSGTICISNDLEKFAKSAKALDIPIYLSGLSSYMTEYDTVELYRKSGIIALHDSALIAAYCKLWLAISNNLDIKKVMDKSIAEDFI